MLGFMRSIALIVLLSISSVCLSHEITQTFNFSYLREFTYDGPGKIEIKQGDKDRLTLTADEDLLGRTNILNHDGTLSISPKKQFFSGKYLGIITGTLEVKNLSRIDLNGSVSVDIDKLQGNELMINLGLEGSSLIEGLLNFQRIAVIINGSSEAALKGKVEEQIVYITGSGLYAGAALESKNAMVHIRGPGTAVINATDELIGIITGYGYIYYVGVPKTLRKRIDGQGEIIPYKERMTQ